jgi:hypothetical protein
MKPVNASGIKRHGYCPSSQLERGEGGVHWVVDKYA